MSMLMRVLRVPEDRARNLPSRPEEVDSILEGSEYPEVDLDKSWGVLNLLFSDDIGGGDEPKDFLLGDGHDVGRDHGYGPPRLYLPHEIEAIAKVVEGKTEANLRALQSHEDLDSVYGGWEDVPWKEEEIAYLTGHLKDLQRFVAESDGHALLVHLY